jgi:hypothetical protein
MNRKVDDQMDTKTETITIKFVGEAIIQGLNVDSGSEAGYCVVRDGCYRNSVEIGYFLLGADGLWGKTRGKRFCNESEARSALMAASSEARIEPRV